jgi:hypothetical protein
MAKSWNLQTGAVVTSGLCHNAVLIWQCLTGVRTRSEVEAVYAYAPCLVAVWSRSVWSCAVLASYLLS